MQNCAERFYRLTYSWYKGDNKYVDKKRIYSREKGHQHVNLLVSANDVVDVNIFHQSGKRSGWIEKRIKRHGKQRY
jgi:hypothetical protein